MNTTLNALDYALIKNEVSMAKERINRDIAELQNKERIIDEINWEAPVTEEQWHLICQALLRISDVFKILVKNTFPEAENIKNRKNYVFFTLKGIECAISTSFTKGIYINMDWYQESSYEFIQEKAPVLANEVLPVLETFTDKFYQFGKGRIKEYPFDFEEFKNYWIKQKYSVVAYDKDGDVYNILKGYEKEIDTITFAKDVTEKMEQEGLRRILTGEPYDWIEVYKDYNTDKEQLIWASYEKEVEQEKE